MEKRIPFYKMSGSGNDFILIDNRNKIVDEAGLSDFIFKVCRRKMSVGADGFILVEDTDRADFKWQFFNSDGSRAEMCGNGARCVARFAYLNGIASFEMSFLTDAGIIFAQVTENGVKVKMPDPTGLKMDYPIHLKTGTVSISSINTGVPHVVIEVNDIDGADVVSLGREIRNHKDFSPAGTNVNFVWTQKGVVSIRTYERGVEDETMACGTGAVASALVLAHKFGFSSPIQMATRSGGILTIHFSKQGPQFHEVHLEGDARIIYRGELWEDAYH